MKASKMKNADVAGEIAAVASKATYTAGAGTIIFGMTAEEFGIVAGVIIGLAGLFINFYFSYKKHKLEAALAKEKINELKDTADVLNALKEYHGVERRKNKGKHYKGVERRASR